MTLVPVTLRGGPLNGTQDEASPLWGRLDYYAGLRWLNTQHTEHLERRAVYRLERAEPDGPLEGVFSHIYEVPSEDGHDDAGPRIPWDLSLDLAEDRGLLHLRAMVAWWDEVGRPLFNGAEPTFVMRTRTFLRGEDDVLDWIFKNPMSNPETRSDDEPASVEDVWAHARAVATRDRSAFTCPPPAPWDPSRPWPTVLGP